MKGRGRGRAGLQTIVPGEDTVLKWSLIFFIVAMVAAFFGFSGIASSAAGIGRVLFYVFIAVFLGTMLLGLINRTPKA